MSKGGYATVKLPFGKYKGQVIGSMPSGYLKWLLEQDWFEDNEEFEPVQDEMQWRKENNIYIED